MIMGQEAEERTAQNAEYIAAQNAQQGAQPGTQNVQPGTQNVQPGTQNVQPGAQNVQPGAGQTPPPGGSGSDAKKPMRISSPEQVDDYIRVTTPGMWLLGAAILVLLVALIIWGFAGKLKVRTVDENGQIATEYIAPASFVTDGVTGY